MQIQQGTDTAQLAVMSFTHRLVTLATP